MRSPDGDSEFFGGGWDSDDSETTAENGVPSHLPRHLIPIQDPEEWADYWSEELAILYHHARDHADQYGWAILDTCTFPEFVQFCWTHSSKVPPPC